MTYHAGTKMVDAVTTVQARADQALTRFDLDFDGNTIGPYGSTASRSRSPARARS